MLEKNGVLVVVVTVKGKHYKCGAGGDGGGQRKFQYIFDCFSSVWWLWTKNCRNGVVVVVHELMLMAISPCFFP